VLVSVLVKVNTLAISVVEAIGVDVFEPGAEVGRALGAEMVTAGERVWFAGVEGFPKVKDNSTVVETSDLTELMKDDSLKYW